MAIKRRETLELLAGIVLVPVVYRCRSACAGSLPAGRGGDDSDALIALFADMARTGRASLPGGTYKVFKPLVIPPGVLEGGNVILDFRGADPANFSARVCALVRGNGPTKLPNLLRDVATGARRLEFSAPHGLRVGETIQLSGTVDFAGNGYRHYYRKGEMFRVARVIDATTIESESGGRDSYPATGVEVWRRSGERFVQSCSSLTILGPDTVKTIVQVEAFDNSRIDNLRVEGGMNHALYVIDCFRLSGLNLRCRQSASGTSNYGIIVGHSQDVRLGGVAYGYFNGITVGGELPTGGKIGMSRDIHFEGSAGSDPAKGLAGANFHGNCEDSSYRGSFSNGVVLGGNKNKAFGEFNGRAGRPAIVFGEMHGHAFEVRGVARTVGVELSKANGAVHMQGFGVNARYGGQTILDLELHVPNATRILWWRPTDLRRTDVELQVDLDIAKAHPATRIMALKKTGGKGGALPLVDLDRLNLVDNAIPILWSVDDRTLFKGKALRVMKGHA